MPRKRCPYKKSKCEEVWKSILGYTGLYEVSDRGNIRRLYSHGYKYLTLYLSEKGYHIVSLSIEGFKSQFRVHRLVAEAFIPNPDNKPQVNHKDGNKDFNFKTNLEWVTNQENIQHSFKHLKRSASYGNTKLVEWQVIIIKARLSLG